MVSKQLNASNQWIIHSLASPLRTPSNLEPNDYTSFLFEPPITDRRTPLIPFPPVLAVPKLANLFDPTARRRLEPQSLEPFCRTPTLMESSNGMRDARVREEEAEDGRNQVCMARRGPEEVGEEESIKERAARTWRGGRRIARHGCCRDEG